MKNMMRKSFISITAVLLMCAVCPTAVHAEDTVTTTTSTTEPTTVTNPTSDVEVNSDQLVVDADGNYVEQKDSTIQVDGTADTDKVTDNNGNSASVVEGSGDTKSTVTLDANGNPVDTVSSTTTDSTTASSSVTTEAGVETTTTVTDTTTTTTSTTSVDQEAIDAAGKEANEKNMTELFSEPVSGTVDGVTYEIKMEDASVTSIAIDLKISEEAQGNQTINLSNIIVDALNESWARQLEIVANRKFEAGMFESAADALAYFKAAYGEKNVLICGDNYYFTINVTTANGNHHTYQYKDNSFLLDTVDSSRNNGPVTTSKGYDDKQISLDYTCSFTSSAPIRNLYGVENSLSIIGLFDKLNVYQVLAAKGYKSKEADPKNGYDNPLTAYILNFYSNDPKYAKADKTPYTSIEELTKLCPRAIDNLIGGDHNSVYEMTYDEYDSCYNNNQVFQDAVNGNAVRVTEKTSKDGYDIQVLWPEEPLQVISYNNFYQNLFEFEYGDEISADDLNKLINSSAGADYGLGDYRNTDGELYQQVNDYLTGKGNLKADGTNVVEYHMGVGINGPLTGNGYQNYNLSFLNTIVFEQVDGGFSVTKVDAEGNTISSSETGYVLYYNDNGTTKYYVVDGDGKISFTENAAEATTLTTTNGVLDVNYLLPGQYFLKEVNAPSGYYINVNDLGITVSSNAIAYLNFTDLTPITKTTTESKTTVTTTVSTTVSERPETPYNYDTPTDETPVEEVKTPETPVKTTNTARPGTPLTDDGTNLGLSSCAMALALLAIVMVIGYRKKYSK